MNTFLFVEQCPSPLALKFVFQEPFLREGALIFDRNFNCSEGWLEPFWCLEYLQQMYIAQNFVTFVHKPLEGERDSRVSPWEGKEHEVLDLLEHIPFPLNSKSCETGHEDEELVSIQKWLDRFIRGATWIDGGAFQAVKIENGVLFLRPDGACYECPYLGMTVHKGIFEPLNLTFPQVRNIQLTYDFPSNR